MSTIKNITIFIALIMSVWILNITGCANLNLGSGSENSIVKGPNETVYALPSQQSKVLYVTKQRKEFTIVEIKEHWTAVLDENGIIGWIYEKDQTAPAIDTPAITNEESSSAY